MAGLRICLAGLLLPLFALGISGCTDDTKHQEVFRGAWSLDTRKAPDGTLSSAPEISGVIEWFPTSETEAHVSRTFSNAKNAIQIYESVYRLERERFEREDRFSLEGRDRSFPDGKSEGEVATENGQTILVHGDGSRYAFEGENLTIRHKDGTVEAWIRVRDQKGVLAK